MQRTRLFDLPLSIGTLPPTASASIPPESKYSRDPLLKGDGSVPLSAHAHPSYSSLDDRRRSSSALVDRRHHQHQPSAMTSDAPSSSAGVRVGSRRVIEHTVLASDTLEGIAITYGIRPDVLKRVNKLFSASSLHMRRTLQIPLEHCSMTPAILRLQQEEADSSAAAAASSSNPDPLGMWADSRRRSLTAPSSPMSHRIGSADGYFAGASPGKSPAVRDADDYASLLAKVDEQLSVVKAELNDAEASLPPPPQPRGHTAQNVFVAGRPSSRSATVLSFDNPPTSSTTSPMTSSLYTGGLYSQTVATVARVYSAVNPDAWREAELRKNDEAYDSMFEL